MDRNAYQRKWRKGEKLLKELIDNLSSSGEETTQRLGCGLVEEVVTITTVM